MADWMAMASAGPYAKLIICTSFQTGNHTSTPSLKFDKPDALAIRQGGATLFHLEDIRLDESGFGFGECIRSARV